MTSPHPSTLVLIGTDAALSYLIGRYAQQSLFHIVRMSSIPTPKEIRSLQPDLVLFTSIERLSAAQKLINELANDEIHIVVCSSGVEETLARELGADACLIHPLTYKQFTTMVKAVGDLHHHPFQFNPDSKLQDDRHE